MVRTPPPLPLHPAAQQVREEAERQAREEAERQAREEAERQAREEAERQVREEVRQQGIRENRPPDPEVAAARPLPGRLYDLSIANLVEPFRGDGTGPTVKDFFRLFENAAGVGRWGREEMINILGLKLKRPAATFLSTQLDKYGDEVEYNILKRDMIERFTGKHSQHYHYSNLSNAVQQKNESVEAFADRVRRLGTLTITPRANPEEQRVVREEAEKRMLHAFLHGLMGPAGQATRHKFPETWDEAVQYAVMIAADERSHPSREQKSVFSTLVTCYNCQRPVHLARECRSPRRSTINDKGMGTPGTPNRGSYGTGRNERGRGSGTGSNSYQRRPFKQGHKQFLTTSGDQEASRRPLSEVECYRCNRKGHNASSCRNSMNESGNRKGPVA